MHTRLDHPVIADRLGLLRDGRTPPARFRALVEELSLYLAYEVSRYLPTARGMTITPLGTAKVRRLTVTPILAPILRAGLALVPGFQHVFPEAATAHLGFYRDPDTLNPVAYYTHVPNDAAQTPVFILDPMLATGGTACAAIATLKRHLIEHMTLVTIVAAPEGIATVERHFPTVRIVTAAIDDGLNDHGYILPGLGDAGDRLYATTHHRPSSL